MDVLVYPDPILRLGGKPISQFDAELRQLADRMMEAMYEEGGVGLAAPQVGVAWQLFVYQAEDDEDPAAGIPLAVIVNPMIEPLAGEPVFDWEGCLSTPDLRGLVPRHPALRLRGVDRHGRPIDRVVEGFEARIVQHEFDHLNGVLFLDRMRDLASLSFLDEWQEFLRGAGDDGPHAKAE